MTISCPKCKAPIEVYRDVKDEEDEEP